MKQEHTEYVKKISQTGGGPPPTPSKLDDLAKLTQETMPDLLLLPHEMFESCDVSQFLDYNENPPVIVYAEDCDKDSIVVVI